MGLLVAALSFRPRSRINKLRRRGAERRVRGPETETIIPALMASQLLPNVLVVVSIPDSTSDLLRFWPPGPADDTGTYEK